MDSINETADSGTLHPNGAGYGFANFISKYAFLKKNYMVNRDVYFIITIHYNKELLYNN